MKASVWQFLTYQLREGGDWALHLSWSIVAALDGHTMMADFKDRSLGSDCIVSFLLHPIAQRKSQVAFHVLAILSHAVVNTGEHVSFWIMVFPLI